MLEYIQAIDANIVLFIQEHLRVAFLNGFMITLGTLGNYGAIWIAISVIMIFFKKTRRIGIIALMSLAFCFLINNVILKNLVCRARPVDVITALKTLIETPSDWSFPSGHTCSAFAAACVYFRYMKNRVVAWLFLVFALLIGISRIYVGVHFVTDVLAGMAVGVIGSQIICILVDKTTKRKNKKIKKITD